MEYVYNLYDISIYIYISILIYIYTHSLSIFCIMFLIILFYSVDGMIYFHDSGMHAFFFKCFVMYLFYACNLSKDS